MNQREFSFWLMLFNTAFNRVIERAEASDLDYSPELIAHESGILADHALLEARKRAPAVPAEPPK